MKSKLDFYIISIKSKIISFVFGLKNYNEKKVIVDNFLGKGYGDNPKYIVEKLHEKDPSLDIVWVVRNIKENMPDYIRKVKYGSFKSLYEYSISKYWIDNVRNNIKPKKKKGQTYLQVWHGPFSSKYIEKQAESKLSSEYVKLAKIDGKISDAILSNSRLQDEQYKNFFWLDKKIEILNFGFPRNDYLINNISNVDLKKSIREKLNLDELDYLILYAPTFRDDFSVEGYKLEFEKIIKSFEKKENKKCKVLVRLHPNVQKYSKCIKYNNKIIDVTSYNSMQDLSLICDSIISDYSSTLFDFAIQYKPAFICALDLDSYKENRGLVKEYYEYPFPFSKSNDELLNNISKFKYSEYKNNLKKFFNINPLYDKGNATYEIVNWLLKK